jgi:hypothetical protein
MTTKIRFPTLEAIRSRACQIRLARFSGHGNDLDD